MLFTHVYKKLKTVRSIADWKSVKMEVLLAFFAQERGKCFNYYHESCAITQTQRTYRITYAEIPPAQISIYNVLNVLTNKEG